MEAPIEQFDHVDRFRGMTSRSVEYTLTHEDGSRIDLTGASINCDFRRGHDEGPIHANLSVGSGITVTDEANGEFELDQVDELDWPLGKYFYDIVVTFPDGSKVLYVAGTRNVLKPVTKL